ncbi:hypothetical protein FHS43_001930 [Streptosporangium becharense]|uniref:Secreted protein n=1 Tax=Streptosporangium becharense TaxID=1816182 RepID=A0A7W9MDX7_9ACTN|nr:hypothetical protein [Streptosporangium becharense]MBB2910667.1 hypothetical protein [Streptosporangium becharense]MBB5817362.1 hypothetical protein [Streptosporangium becharense]
MIHLRSVLTRTAAIAVLGLAVVGVPAAASAASVGATAPAVQQDACSTVAAVAGPILALVDLGLINLDTAVQMIADLTGLPVEQVVGCLGV